MGGVRVRLWEVVDTEFWPGPQTGVHLREVSASGGSTVVDFEENMNIVAAAIFGIMKTADEHSGRAIG